MLAKIFSASVSGVEADLVEVEVNAGHGDCAIVVVGLPDTAVKECKDRVTTAVINSGYHFHTGRTTINLAPADVRKEGPSFDLPIALGMLISTGQLQSPTVGDYFAVGELALTGKVRPVRGVLSIALKARQMGLRGILVPVENAREAAVVAGLEVYAVRNLREAAELLKGGHELKPVEENVETLFQTESPHDLDFADVKGQDSVKRAIEIAAAGSHNLLLIGPPGSGKSMLAKRIPGIMPPLSLTEALETTKIHSIAGSLPHGQALVVTRPYRSPHHTISDIGMVGGSSQLRPGEVSLAHNGVLFLDELPEFKRQTLEILRQPLEDHRVNISRASGSVTFPCSFMLIAAMNPSPAGTKGVGSASSIRRYLDKISRPLLDRFDIHIEVPAVPFSDLSSKKLGEPSAVIRQRVMRARHLQKERFAGRGKVLNNAGMGSRELREYCPLTHEVEGLLRIAMNELNFSARAHDRILKVARTIADLVGEEMISAEHISEAIQFRNLDRTLWQ
ncbi:MAG: YifB family Mg chelatase-like AAA ATPase [Verrucomicrobiae bacterium]|nr:YifB family Mg chelatase-like AAA ATPase [Verrucomicrobiae bacterium]